MEKELRRRGWIVRKKLYGGTNKVKIIEMFCLPSQLQKTAQSLGYLTPEKD